MANNQLNWSHFKSDFSGKPEEDVEAHLLRTNDWMTTHDFPNDQKFLLRHPQHSTSFSNQLQPSTSVFWQVTQSSLQGKMHIYATLIAVVLISLHEVLAVDIMPELKKNVLNFRYGVNFKYEGMLTHSLDRLYIVAKYKIPKVEPLQFTKFSFDLTCNHLNISKTSYLLRYIRYCRRIAPYVKFYKQQIDYYNWTAYNILQNEIGLILPSFNNRKKRFLTTILGTIASKAIGLVFEGISSFLHHKRHKALQKAVNIINSRSEIDHNRVYHLENMMIMYGKYNSHTLMELVKTVHQMQNVTTWKEKIFVSEMNKWLKHKLADIHN